MKVLKFGGSSVANSKNIKQVLKIIANSATEEKVIVVVSAFGKTTNSLLEIAKLSVTNVEAAKEKLIEVKNNHFQIIEELIPSENEEIKTEIGNLFQKVSCYIDGISILQELSAKTLAKIGSFGEVLSSKIIAKAASLTLDAGFADSKQLIKTDQNFLNGQVDFDETNQNINTFFASNRHQIIVLGGFIASNKQGETTNLGRGGSDYSAAIYAAALTVNELQIWTDVSGMFTANPSLVKQAYPIEKISYEEAMELSHFGAKVLYPPTIQPSLKKSIPIRIKNTFMPKDKGTLICNTAENSNGVKGISHIENISLITLEGSGMVGVPGFSKRLFEALSFAKINVAFITQASSEHSICVGVFEDDIEKANTIVNEHFSFEIDRNIINPISIEKDLAIVAIVGESMKNHQGLSGRMFSTLGKNNVNVRAIAQGSSEKNISAVIRKTDAKKALNALHEQFFEENIKQLNLFVMGVGNVGGRFLAQLYQQKDYLREELKLNIRVVGISNSKKMKFNQEGINLSNWKTSLNDGEPTSLSNFYDKILDYNLRNSVFIDITANADVANTYHDYLTKSIAVVTCNKIACSSSYENYKNLKSVSKKYNAAFLFETNVGAGLPIIDTLKNLITSGDRVHKIQAVLSGSLNFVFNHFSDETTFHQVVEQAQKEGFTEPDPKIDLSGVDVARKILILARESGYKLELEDIENDSFLPSASLEAKSLESFYDSLKIYEEHFQNRYQEAKKQNCQLKYVASFENGKATVGLQNISPSHPFYNLEGSDNIVLFYTDRYASQPLLIKGAGAGAEVTASGIFADVIRIGNQ